MLVHRLRRLPNIKTTSAQRYVSAGSSEHGYHLIRSLPDYERDYSLHCAEHQILVLVTDIIIMVLLNDVIVSLTTVWLHHNYSIN